MARLLEASSGVDTTPLGPDWSGLLQVVLALVIVSAAAYLVLRALSARGLGRLQKGALQVEQRVALDAYNGLVVLQVEGRRLLLSVHRHAAARLLAELSPEAAVEAAAPAAPTESEQP